MDVRSCGSRDHQPRGTRAQADGRIRRNARSPERAQDSRALFLTDDLHGWRFCANRPNILPNRVILAAVLGRPDDARPNDYT
jgi:hypothetical protein